MPQSGRALRKLLDDRLLGALVGHRDEVGRPLRLTCSCSTSPKSRRSRGAALRAARCMTVMRPEWRNHGSSPRGGHIPVVDVDDDARSAADVRRDHHRTPLSSTAGL
jgi:hypothetical protein